MLMNCKEKIHEKLVFETPQNPEAIEDIRAYLWRCFLCNDVEM